MYFNKSAELPDAPCAPEMKKSDIASTTDTRLAMLIMFICPNKISQNSTYVSGLNCVADHIRTTPRPVVADIISMSKTSKIAIADGLDLR